VQTCYRCAVCQSVCLSRMHRMTPHCEADFRLRCTARGHSVQPLSNVSCYYLVWSCYENDTFADSYFLRLSSLWVHLAFIAERILNSLGQSQNDRDCKVSAHNTGCRDFNFAVFCYRLPGFYINVFRYLFIFLFFGKM